MNSYLRGELEMISEKKTRHWRAAHILLSALLAVSITGCAGKTIKRNAVNGVSVQVFEWGFWSGNCQATDFTIKITQGPEFGVAEIGTDTMTIGRESASGARMACEGKTIASKVVKYKATNGFKGTDEIRLSIAGRASAPRLFTLLIDVR